MLQVLFNDTIMYNIRCVPQLYANARDGICSMLPFLLLWPVQLVASLLERHRNRSHFEIGYVHRYGRPSATDEEVRWAAKSAALHDAIMDHFPAGYETLVRGSLRGGRLRAMHAVHMPSKLPCTARPDCSSCIT